MTTVTPELPACPVKPLRMIHNHSFFICHFGQKQSEEFGFVGAFCDTFKRQKDLHFIWIAHPQGVYRVFSNI